MNNISNLHTKLKRLKTYKSNEGQLLINSTVSFLNHLSSVNNDLIMKELQRYKTFLYNICLSLGNIKVGVLLEKLELIKLIVKYLINSDDEEIKFLNQYIHRLIEESNVNTKPSSSFFFTSESQSKESFMSNYNIYFKRTGFIICNLKGEICVMDEYSKEVIFERKVSLFSNFFDLLNENYLFLFNYKVKDCIDKVHTQGIITISFKVVDLNKDDDDKELDIMNQTKTLRFKLSKINILNKNNELSLGILIELGNSEYYEYI